MVGAEALAVAMVGQDLDHPAIGDPAPVAPGEHALELGPERGEPFEAPTP